MNIPKKLLLQWSKLIRNDKQLQKILNASGKERGHSTASFVEERALEIANELSPIEYDRDTNGKKAARALSDGFFAKYPKDFLNIKTSFANGHPNICSLRRLTTQFIEGKLDDYILVHIQFDIEYKTIQVHFISLFNIIEDYVSFDAGPQQMMLEKKRLFDSNIIQPIIASRSAPNRVAMANLLIKKYEEGVQRLMKNRQKTISTIKQKAKHIK